MESFRKFVQGWLGRTMLVLVLAVFVVTMFWDTTPPGAQGELVEVNGEKIFQGELDQAVESIMGRYAGQIDRETLSKLIDRNGVLESLVRQRVLVDAAEDLGLVAHPATVQQSIQAIEGFHDESGKFSEQVFQQVIARNGFANAAAFRQRVADELLSSQLTGGLRDSAFATRGELELLTRIGEQKRDLSWAVLSPAAFVATVNATDAEVKARYDGNPAGYMTEEQFAIEYVEVSLDQYAAAQSPTDVDVQAKYDQMVAQAQESAERRVAQIQISTAGRDQQQAMARADEALAKLAAGEAFAAVAAAYSDDAGSRDSAGDLGFVSRGVLEPALDQALFTLKPGDVSRPVVGADGVYLLKLLEVRAVAVPPLAQARAGIVAALSRDKAREQYDSVLEELGNLAYEADNLQEPAAKLGLQVQSTGLFGRSGGPGIAASQKVLKELLSPHVLEDGQNSAIVAVDESRSVVLRLKEHRKPERRPLEEVAGAVRNDIVREKAAEVAKQKIETVRKAVAGGASLDSAAAAEGATVQVATGVQRNDTSVPREVLLAAFRLKKAEGGALAATTTELTGGSWAVIAVGAVVDGTLLGVPPEQVAALRGELAGEFGRAEFNRYLDEATARADVVRLRADDKKAPADALD